MDYNYNPYQPYQPYQNRLQMMQQPQPQQVVRVSGEAGAAAYQMPPNSSALLLDETAPLVWLVTTDGAGYKTKTPYKIEPYVQQKPDDIASGLEERIRRLEEIINEQSNVRDVAKRPGKQSNANAE